MQGTFEDCPAVSFDVLSKLPLAAEKWILLLGGFLLGFVPQFRKASALRNELRGRDERIARIEREASLSRARDLASLLYLELTRRNYGIAAQQCCCLFYLVRTMRSDSAPELRTVLERVLSHREAVTAGVVKSDPAALSYCNKCLDEPHAVKS